MNPDWRTQFHAADYEAQMTLAQSDPNAYLASQGIDTSSWSGFGLIQPSHSEPVVPAHVPPSAVPVSLSDWQIPMQQAQADPATYLKSLGIDYESIYAEEYARAASMTPEQREMAAKLNTQKHDMAMGVIRHFPSGGGPTHTCQRCGMTLNSSRCNKCP